MNVLFVLEHYHPYIGGAEKLFKLLAESLVNRGFSVKVITTLYKDSLPQKEEINGVQIIRVRSKNRYFFTLFSLGVIFKYRRWPNLIHTTTYNAAIPSSIVGFMCQIPVTITVHEIWGKLWYKMPMLTLYERILYSLFESIVLKFPFNKYIGVSDYTYNSLIQRLPADKCVKILNGFPNKEKCNQATHNSSNIPEWLFYGRLGASKGIDIFLDALQILSEDKIKANVTLVIPTYPIKMFHWVKIRVESLRLLNQINISLVHELTETELESRICNSDAVVLPSRSEGFGFAIAEACQMGALVITTQEGSISEVVSGKYIQIEFPKAQLLAKALITSQRGEYSTSEIRYFSIKEMIDGYENLFKSFE